MMRRLLRALHILAFVAVCAVLTIGGALVINSTLYSVGIGMVVMAVAIWGWLVSGYAMIYWQARISPPDFRIEVITRCEAEAHRVRRFRRGVRR